MLTQKEQILALLKIRPRTTADFCNTPGLAAEYRRAISELRRDGHNIPAPKRLRQGNWEYALIDRLQEVIPPQGESD